MDCKNFIINNLCKNTKEDGIFPNNYMWVLTAYGIIKGEYDDSVYDFKVPTKDTIVNEGQIAYSVNCTYDIYKKTSQEKIYPPYIMLKNAELQQNNTVIRSEELIVFCDQIIAITLTD